MAADVKRFAWLADAPLFIDKVLIERFYDAVISPAYKQVEYTTRTDQTEGAEGGGEGGVEVKVGLGKSLLSWITGVDIEAKAAAKANLQLSESQARGSAVRWIPIHTPQRQLGQLILSYDALSSGNRK